MAFGRTWYKRRGGDFVMATLSFPDSDHKWAYSAIIDMLNERDRPIADDPGFVCGFTGLSKKRWTPVRAWLLAHGYLIIDREGNLTNPHFERERADRHQAREIAVETGREGGKKSAALRAAGQGDLDLGQPPAPSAPPRTRAHGQAPKSNLSRNNPEIIGRLSPDKSDEREPEPPENNDLAEGPPQAPCAREEEIREESTQLLSSHVQEVSSVETGSDDNPPRVQNLDLKAKLDAVLDACGYNPISPTAIDRALKIVEDWHQRGLDFDDLVLPAIRAVVAETPEPTRTLGRFRARIDHDAARTRARKANGHAPVRPVEIKSPILEPKGEDPIFRPVRQALLGHFGERLFALLYNDVRFEAAQQGDKRPLVVNGRDYMTETVVRGLNAPAFREIAQAHGFTDLWKGRE